MLLQLSTQMFQKHTEAVDADKKSFFDANNARTEARAGVREAHEQKVEADMANAKARIELTAAKTKVPNVAFRLLLNRCVPGRVA